MSLNKQDLIDALNSLPNSKDNLSASEQFALAFEKYFKNAVANGTISVQLSSTTLQPILLETMNSNTVLQTLGTSIQSWASTWIFADPTFTSSATVAVGASLDAELAIVANDPANGTIETLAEKIHNWATLNITTTLTNNQSGATIPGEVT